VVQPPGAHLSASVSRDWALERWQFAQARPHMKGDSTWLKTTYFSKMDGGGSAGGDPDVEVVPTVDLALCGARFKLQERALSVNLSRDRVSAQASRDERPRPLM
jgi:hypothetical protein